ncbi:MAG: hypothetical protein ACERKV_04175 [Clostridiaceae bacterium]
MKKRLSLILILVLLILVGGYLYSRRYEHSRDTNLDSFKVSNYEKPPENIESIDEDENFFSDLSDKEKIHYKLLNSIDYFKTVEGEIDIFGISYDNRTVKYIIDKDNNRSVEYTKSEEKNLKTIYNDFKCIELNSNDNTYRDLKVLETADTLEKKNELRKLKPGQRYNPDKSILSRCSLLIDDANMSIFSESILSEYMMDYDKWSIEGHETFLERDCTKIVGRRHGTETRSQAESYIALIDSETGIVLKYDELNSDNKIVNGFETKYIKFDNSYDETIFSTSTEGYVEKECKGK